MIRRKKVKSMLLAVIAVTFSVIMTFGIYTVVLAEETSDVRALKSHGNIVYEGIDGGTVSIYESDLRLLDDKIATIPKETFDPKNY